MSAAGPSGSEQRPDGPVDHRVEIDFQIDFSNGGGIQGQGFRLDIPGDDISDADVSALLVRELGLLMVGEVRIAARTILSEPHRRRGRPHAGRRVMAGASSSCRTSSATGS